MQGDMTSGDGQLYNNALKAAVDAIAGIMEGTMNPIAVLDRDLRYATFNTAYRDSLLKHFGASVHLGDNLEQVLAHAPEYQHAIIANWQRALEGESFCVDQHKDDPEGRVWYETRYAPIYDENGVVVGASHISKSMSERIQKETELRQSKEKFRVLFENAADAIFVQDLDGSFFDANHKAIAQVGYSKEELLHMSPQDIDAPEHIPEIQSRLGKAIHEGETTFESVQVRKDGTSMPVEVSSKLIVYEGRQAVLSVVRDLTERHRALQAAQEREELYRGLFLNEHTAMLLIDPETNEVVEANPAAAEFYGYRREDFRGLSLSIFNPGSDDFISHNIQSALDFSQNRFELTHRLASGALSDVEVLCGPVYIGGRQLLFSIVNDVTGRKRTERALRESEERFRAFFRNSPVPTALLSWAGGVVADANDSLLDFLGYTLDEVTGKSTMELGLWVDTNERTLIRNTLETTGKVRDAESRIRIKSGELRTVLISGDYMELDGEGFILLVAKDISRRKEIEQELRRSEERFRLVLENSRDAIHMLDLKTRRYTFMSPAQAQLTGFELQELLERPADALFQQLHPDDREWVEKYLEQVIKGEDPGVPVEYRWKVQSGEYRWFSDTRKAIVDEKGNAVALVGVSRDVTWRKEMEDQLIQAANEASTARRESERRTAELQAALQSVPVGTLFYNTDHTISYLNKSAENLTGYTLDDIRKSEAEERLQLFGLSRTDNSPYRWEDLPGYRALQGEVVTHDEFLIRPRGSNQSVHVLSQAAPIIHDGHIIGAVQTVTDITERKKIEAALSKAKQEADRASKAKSEFMANMSHEIRTPLTGLLGMTDLLLDSLKKEKNLEYVRYMKRAGEALRIIIDDILDLSKIEAGKMELVPRPVQTRESIHQGVALFEPMARRKGVGWTITLAPELPDAIQIDESKLHQVLRNLVSNAVKFTTRGSITVAASYDDAEMGKVMRIEIQDTGVGIPEERRSELFQEFTQLDSSYQKIHGGTGLGLSISKKLVELMGGEISFESEMDKGSTFTVTLPAPEADYSEEENQHIRELEDCSHLRILAAEDNPINQVLIREMLAQSKCQFTLVENGEKVLKELEKATKPYDIVLMDINMPQLDGIQATRRIRESGEAYAGIPIIALTAYAMPEERDRFFAAGMDGYLSKPFTTRQLFKVLADLPNVKTRQRQQADGQSIPEMEEDCTPQDAHTSASEEREMLDKAYLEEHFGRNKDNLYSLIRLIEEDTPDQLDRLGELIHQHQCGEAADQAHYVASGCRTVGMMYVAEESLRIEQFMRDECTQEAEDAFVQLRHDFDRSMEALKEWAGRQERRTESY
eukprot:TRINITY_DN2931_c0_g1_i1.p2 TRINITY_DN2931_c0_g1~~TRINITY_DN2931_c0_g1_i1.p2  ORF type:complete len:1330 (+),score=257.74 TRINITY_DN2931_c0_g1_i1:6470-10459(+)